MHTSVCWHTALLEDVSITVMAQVDEASIAPAFLLNIMVVCNIRNFSLVRFYRHVSKSSLNSFLMEQISQIGPKTKNYFPR